MEFTFNVGESSSSDEPDNINNNDIQSVEFIDQWPIDIGSCDGDDIIKEYLDNVKTSSSVEPNRGGGDDDCMILDGDPAKPVVAALDEKIESDGILIVKEKGQVACRDFPHARHLCANFPFSTTSHEQHCKMCYCFVCDSPAPCKFWSNNPGCHCHASDKFESWISLRKKHKDGTIYTNKAIRPSHRQASNVPINTNKAIVPMRRQAPNVPINTNNATAPTQRQAPNVLLDVNKATAPTQIQAPNLPNSSGPDFPHFRHLCGDFPFKEVPDAFSSPDCTYQQQVLDTHYMNQAYTQTQACQKSKRQPYRNVPSNMNRCLGPPLVHQTQFKRPGTTPGYVGASRSRALQTLPKDEDTKKFWLKLAALADELEDSECNNKHGSEP